MTIALRYAARSDVGLVRSNNQDSGYAGPHLLAVADGMGGHAGGDVASSVAIAHLVPLDEEAHGLDDAMEELSEALTAAHEELLELATQSPQLAGMGTTVTALLRSGNKLVMAHIGDSRAYLLREDDLIQVTTDHSFVQHLVNTGKLTPEEAEQHPQRSVLLRVLGDFDMEVAPDLSVREARPGDRWLLCSDGLSGVVSQQTIAKTMLGELDPDACADRLLELAIRGGAPDNVTVVICDVVDVDQLPDGAAPTTASYVVGAAAVDRNRPTRGGKGSAARAAAQAKREEPSPDADDAPPSRGVRRRLLWVLGAVVLLAGLGVAGWLGYRWTQQQYYVGIADDHIAIYRGIPQTVGPLQLSEVVETSPVEVADLPPYFRTRLESTIPAETLADARDRMSALEDEADG